MSLTNKFPNVIHPTADADFDNFTYYGVYAGVDATVVINGKSVTMSKGSTLNIKVGSIDNVANVFVLGTNKDVADGLSYTGFTSERLGGSAFL